jgi:hypothetical protein
MGILVLGLLAFGLSLAAAAQPRAVPHAWADPAVFTFTDFVEHRMRPPLSDATIRVARP